MGISNYTPSSRISQSGVCTSSTRPASPFEGQVIYETDTDRVLVWNGTAWYPNWNLPWGVVAYNSRSTSDATITSEEVQITGSSFTAVAGRLYKISYFEPGIFPASGGGYVGAKVRLGSISGTVLNEGYEQAEVSGTTNRFFNLLWVGTLSAGVTNIVGTLLFVGGTGHSARSATTLAFLVVEDIGPA
jgi:hypothetical protein